MKQIVGLMSFLVFSSCYNQRRIVSNVNECEIKSYPSEVIHLEYLSLRADSDFYKNEFVNFSTVKNGVLLYRWQEGSSGEGQFLIIDFEKGFAVMKDSKNSSRAVHYLEEEKKNLQSISLILKKESYFQTCRYVGHSTVSVLIVRANNEEVVQYFSPFESPYGIETLDSNVDFIKEMFGLLEKGLYRKL